MQSIEDCQVQAVTVVISQIECGQLERVLEFWVVQIPKAQAGNGDNHAVSAMKFRVLRKFLRLGYSVFLSDVDIVVLQNPFKFLTRDSDIEGMTDGFDNNTAYGLQFMPPASPCAYHATRLLIALRRLQSCLNKMLRFTARGHM